MSVELIELQRLLSNAVAIKSTGTWRQMDSEAILAVCDFVPETRWILSFCPEDRCFRVTVAGRERLRTDSPQIACAYFTARQPRGPSPVGEAS